MHWSEYKLEGWDGSSIRKKIEYENITILLLDISRLASPLKEGRKNLIAIDAKGEIKWIAELPLELKNMYASYNSIEAKDDILLKAWSESSFCELEVDTGKVILVKFVK